MMAIKIYLLRYFIVIPFIIFGNQIFAQKPVKYFNKELVHTTYYLPYSSNKTIPNTIKTQALIALSFYPELKDTNITFRFRKRITPLASRPRIFSVLKGKEKRKYVITISTSSKEVINPILFSNLPFNAQIGVLGHELGHISEYIKKNSFQLMVIPFKLFNRTYTNHFEFNTDLICINHGLGYQLFDWSIFVRRALKIPEWKGASDLSNNQNDSIDLRYMNPETIKKYMNLNKIYKHYQTFSNANN